MELALMHRTETQIRVTCDGQHSHFFDLDSLLLRSEKELFDDPVAYGKKIYEALFPRNTLAQRSLPALPERLLFVAEGNDLDAVPWEYAYGPEGFLVLECHFVRGLPGEQRFVPPTLDNDLYIVAVPSNPLSERVEPLNIDGEWLRLKEVIQEVPYAITLERTRPASLERTRQLLANQKNRVVHFMGHGGQDEHGALLCLEKDNGDLDLVAARQFMQRVRDTVFLVTLNACVSAKPGATAFSNLAAALVRQRTPYALGMRLSIIDEDARTFSRTFYSELARGSSVEEAIFQARLTLSTSSRSWVIGVPVLYTSLASPATGFTSVSGTPTIKEHQPPIEVTALSRAEGVFQGRVDELKKLGNDLTGDSRPRIVTIHGGGGLGKTALAREAVERFAYAWPGGVWATTLENLPSRAIFVTDLARFLGIATQEIFDPTEVERQVLARVVQRRLLVVLDNAETMIEAVEAKNAAAIQLAQFVQQLVGPSVSLLVTSRTQLQWSGEVSHQLSGLSPDEGAALFRQSAPQRTGDIDIASAQRLSKKVDGHPLSLRLLGGAFNASIISLLAFAEAYESRLLAAENKYVEVEHRHRTLYACIETSLRYLDANLRGLLSGLWIFHAPFMDQSAVSIFDPDAEDSAEKPSHIRDDLHTLWLRGLLERRTMIVRDNSLTFYYLPPTTRPYVEQHLERAYEREKLLSRFALTYFILMVWLYQNLSSTATALAIVQQLRDDLERGVAIVPEEGQGKYRMCWGWIQYMLGYPQSALKLLESALEIAQGADQNLEAVTMTMMATVYRDTGQPQEARRLYQQALPIERKIGNRKEEANTLYQLGRVYDDTGQPHEALQLYEQALAIRREVGDRVAEAAILNDMAGIYNHSGKTQEALQLYNESLSIAMEENYWGGAATTLDNIASICSSLGMPKKALEFYEQALPIRREVGDRLGEAITLANIALTYLLLGQPQDALRLYQQALLIQKQISDLAGQAKTLNGIANVYHTTGQQQEALRLCQQALAIAQEIGDRDSEESTLREMAGIYHAIGQPQEALRVYEQALLINKEIGYLAGEAGVLGGIAGVYHSIGRSQEALELYAQSLSICMEIGHKIEAATTAGNMALVYQSLGQLQEALEWNELALPILREVGYQQGEAAALNNMAVIYESLGQPEKSLQLCQQALPIVRAARDRNGEAMTLGNMALAYNALGQLQEALQLCQRALPILREVENRAREATVLSNMAGIYRTMGQLQKALQLFQQALPILHEVGNLREEANTLCGVANVYQSSGQVQEAIHFFEQALHLYRQIGDRKDEATMLHNIGSMFLSLRQPQEALRYFQQSLPISSEIGDVRGETATLNNMALMYCYLLRQPQEALTLCQRALAVHRSVGDQGGEATAFSTFAHAYYFMGERQKAIAHMGRAIALLKEAGLSQDSSGQTLDDLQSSLQKMSNGTLFEPSGEGQTASASAQTRADSIMAEEQLQMIVEKTIESMTTKSHGRHIWRRLMENGLQAARQQGDDWQIEVDFFRAVIDILDGRSRQLPKGHPYAPALKAIQQGIAEYRGRDDLTSHEGEPDVLEHIIRNTIAVLGPMPEMRNEWRVRMVELRNLALQSKAQHLAAFVNELIGLLDANGNPKGLGTNLHSAYAKIWQDIVNQVTAYQDDVR